MLWWMWLIAAGLGGSVAIGASALYYRKSKRKRIRARRRIRTSLGKKSVEVEQALYRRDRNKQANRAGLKAGFLAAFPWLVAAGRSGRKAFQDAKHGYLHPPTGTGPKAGPRAGTKPGPKPRPSPAGPKALERHSVVLNKKPGPGTGGGTGHLCGAPLKADKKRSCHQPVECPNHGPKCDLELHCHWHGGKSAKPTHGRFGGKGPGR